MSSRGAMPVPGTYWGLMGRPSLLTGMSLTSATPTTAWARLALCSSTGTLQVSVCQAIPVAAHVCPMQLLLSSSPSAPDPNAAAWPALANSGLPAPSHHAALSVSWLKAATPPCFHSPD